MSDLNLDAIRPLVERYPTATNKYQMDLALRIAEASPALLAEVDRLREQLFAQKPVIEAAEAWAELHEDNDVRLIRSRSAAPAVANLYDAIEQYRLMDLALTSARDEAVAAMTTTTMPRRINTLGGAR